MRRVRPKHEDAEGAQLPQERTVLSGQLRRTNKLFKRVQSCFCSSRALTRPYTNLPCLCAASCANIVLLLPPEWARSPDPWTDCRDVRIPNPYCWSVWASDALTQVADAHTQEDGGEKRGWLGSLV